MSSYREAMASFAKMRTMDIWYAHLDEDQLDEAAVRSGIADLAKAAKTGTKAERKAGGEENQGGEEGPEEGEQGRREGAHA